MQRLRLAAVTAPGEDAYSRHLLLTTYAHQTVRVDADIVIPPGGMVMITSPHGVAGAVKVRKLLPDGTLRCKPHKKKDKV